MFNVMEWLKKLSEKSKGKHYILFGNHVRFEKETLDSGLHVCIRFKQADMEDQRVGHFCWWKQAGQT